MKNKGNISTQEIQDAQNQWGNTLIAIRKAYAQKQDYKTMTEDLVDKLYSYNYGENIVLFKPTLAKEIPFRKTKAGALSYFIGDNTEFPEDQGFALRPWIKVEFENDEIIFSNDIAIAMGHYDLTDQNGELIRAEYTFGYIKDDDNNLRIILQHSSLPHSG